jgi:hypothetical protein
LKHISKAIGAVILLALAGCSSELDVDAPDDKGDRPVDIARQPRPSDNREAKPPVVAQLKDPFQRADRSFSRYRLNAKFDPVRAGLQLANESCDDLDFLCEWRDAKSVRHILGGELLAIKLLIVEELGREKISALGIGEARSRSDVVANVRAFLPEVKISCLEAGNAGEGEGIASCSGTFDNGGWIKLLFDDNDQLILARIDAFQIN